MALTVHVPCSCSATSNANIASTLTRSCPFAGPVTLGTSSRLTSPHCVLSCSRPRHSVSARAAAASEHAAENAAQAGAVRKVYWGSGSAPAWRVLLTVEEKALPYEGVQISFSEREQKKPPVIDLNPRGQVPVLVDGEVVVRESGAACLYLEEAYPNSGTSLLPASLSERAHVWQLCWEMNNITSAFRPVVVETRQKEPNLEKLKEAKEAMKKELGHWEKYLQHRTYFLGDTFSLADVMAFPVFATLDRFGLDFGAAGFPALASYFKHMSTRPSVSKTWPPHWKETPSMTALADL